MANYSSKFRVFQDWGNPATGTAGEQNVFVFGPKYMLERYTDEDEKAGMTPVPFSGVSGDVTFEGVVKAYADYELRGLDVYVENAFVKISDIDVADAYVSGEYTDGIIVVRGEVTGVKAGDYFYFVDGDGIANNIKIAKDPETAPDAEYEGDVWTEIQLTTGLDDSFEGGIPDGFKLFFAKKVDSLKVSSESVAVHGEDVVLTLDTASADGVLLSGDAFFSTKRIYTGETGKIDLAASVGDVTEDSPIGLPDPENPIAMGVYNAFAGGAPAVYYYVTAGDSKEAFMRALDRATLDKTLYYMVPMTQDREILNQVAAYCDTQSDEDHKRWKVMVACSDVQYVVRKDGFNVVDNGQYGKDVKFVTLKFEDEAPDVVSGDVIVVGDVSFTVVRRLNRTTVLTDTRFAAEADAVVGDAYFTHTRSNSEYAKAVAASATNLATHRAVDVFPKRYRLLGEEYSGMFMAPAIAGLAASVEPQAPISNMTVRVVDDIPDIYGKLTSTDLDTMAAGGAFIVTQDMEGERCYVRKQLTTGTPSGVLAKTELSMVKNYDSIAYVFNDVIEGFKGNYNVTPELINMIYLALDGTVYALQNNATSAMIGPQLLADSDVDRVEQDPVNAAKINAWVHCDLPVPFNDMDLYLSVVTTAQSAGVQGTEE